jgi:hypothetical protein
MIQSLLKKLVIELNFKSVNDLFENIKYTLEYSIENSIVKKDIKFFLLFLYLHDISNISTSYYHYDSWIFEIKYGYAYYIDNFIKDDLDHYKDDIKDDIDSKILLYLKDNMEPNNKFFLKRYSWLKLDKIKLFKIYSKCIGKLVVFYFKTLEYGYKPGGRLYLQVLEKFNKTIKLNDNI